MTIYSYKCTNGDVAWGFKIFTDDTKKILSYEAAGFKTEEEARAEMNNVLAWFSEMDTSLNLNERLLQKWLKEFEEDNANQNCRGT